MFEHLDVDDPRVDLRIEGLRRKHRLFKAREIAQGPWFLGDDPVSEKMVTSSDGRTGCCFCGSARSAKLRLQSGRVACRNLVGCIERQLPL